MRIIGGTLRGRRLSPVKGDKQRPTLDQVREALFNILGGDCSGERVLDLFAGTGALGLEALSRGAASCLFVDRDGRALARIKDDLTRFGLEEQGTILRAAFPGGIKKAPRIPEGYSLIFLDPPYFKGFVALTLKALADGNLISTQGRVIVEHHIKEEVPGQCGGLILTDRRCYGDTCLAFYAKES